jgi:uncharacterized protein YkwD
MLRSVLAVLLIAGIGTSLLADESTARKQLAWQGTMIVGAPRSSAELAPCPRCQQAAVARSGLATARSLPIPAGQQPATASPAATETVKPDGVETKLLELTNKERVQLRVAPLLADPELMRLAREHATTMARLDRLGHNLDGKPFSQRIESYRSTTAGENVAQGQQTPAEAVGSWMQSPGHRANILQSQYTRVGVAFAKSKSGQLYWAQIFANPQ